MLSAWRIVREKYAGKAFSGEGAAEYGGRWNSPGSRVVYTSESLALASLELLVHLNPRLFLNYQAFSIRFAEGLVEKMAHMTLPGDWRTEPVPVSTMRVGDRWIREKRTAVLAVPSVIIPDETNYILNPLHEDYQEIEIGTARAFTLDSRLL